MYEKRIIASINDNIELKKAILADDKLLKIIEKISIEIVNALKRKNKIIFAGNGGSFSDAQHLATEFVSRFKIDRKPLHSVALGANGSTLSAIGNDYDFENIFARELEAIANKKDVFIPISTSGRSKNILQSVNLANRLGLKVFGFTGKFSNPLNDLCECINIPTDNTARIQECHILLGHIICDLSENELFK